MKLKDRVAFVTGAASGIGAAVAAAYAREGAQLVLVDIHENDSVLHAVRERGGEALWVQADMRNTEEVDRAVTLGIEKFGKVDILFAGAAITGVNPALCFEMSDEEFETVIDINLTGYFRCCRAVLPSMLKQNYGRIILVGSICGIRQGWETRVHYAASKGGVEAMTRSLAVEVAPFGVTVNCLAPGLVRTAQSLDPRGFAEAGLQRAAREILPVGFVADPEDIAPFAIMLASKESRYFTGQTILIDGGTDIRTTSPQKPINPFR